MKNNMQVQLTPEPNQAQIGALAYQKWEEAGRPQGRDLDFWLQAESQLRALAQKVTAAPAKETAKVVAMVSPAPRTQRPLRLPGNSLGRGNHRSPVSAGMR
jgi:hypothetical protein